MGIEIWDGEVRLDDKADAEARAYAVAKVLQTHGREFDSAYDEIKGLLLERECKAMGIVVTRAGRRGKKRR